MGKWNKIKISNEKGGEVEAIVPEIISASRSTDIPSFYSNWFFNRLSKGYLIWVNPFNRKGQYVSFKNCRLIVFWTKNAAPILDKLQILDNENINYYFQYTINNYEPENLEPNVPPLEKRINTFIRLSEKIGKEKVIWRFDPLILSDKITVDILIKRIRNVGTELNEYTNKLVISFADIDRYRKVQKNLSKLDNNYREFNREEVFEFSEKLEQINKELNLKIATCAEKYDLSKYNISKNKCIDDELIVKLFSSDTKLMDFIGYDPQQSIFGNEYTSNPKLKDKGQREECGCIKSKDIGMYNTCKHLCHYCYANSNASVVEKNYRAHSKDNESIIKL